MRDRSDRYQVQTVPIVASTRKRLGSYLVEAGLLTTAQLDVALNDQKMTEQMTGTHMQLGEIVAARGWIKEQTIEYLMEKVILPERRESVSKKEQDTVRQYNHESGTRQKKPVDSVSPQSNPGKSAASSSSGETNGSTPAPPTNPGQNFPRREAPISKPLPPVKSPDGDVNWVG